MITLNNETEKYKRSPLDISKMGTKYRTENKYYVFQSPTLETIEKNYFWLLRNSKIKKFNQKYRFRPDYLSNKEYGTPMLWQLLMFINGVFSVEEFDLVEVIIPALEVIMEITKDNYPDLPPDQFRSIAW
jgi:hypothetical protein